MEGDPAVGSEHVVVGLVEHVVELVQGEVFRQDLVGELVDPDEGVQLNHAGDVAHLEPGDGERLLEAVVSDVM